MLFQTVLHRPVISSWGSEGRKRKLEGMGANFTTTAAEIPPPPLFFFSPSKMREERGGVKQKVTLLLLIPTLLPSLREKSAGSAQHRSSAEQRTREEDQLHRTPKEDQD